jgi:NAD(P)-dependent dehydrogenase (short-subunit alcohol dehydrogenase family)
MAGRLQDKVVVITGGSSGIGRASVELFAEEGARVVVGDIDAAAGEELVAAVGDAVAFQRTDVTREEDIAALVDRAVALHGRLDVMFNNAGSAGESGPLLELDPDGFDRSVRLLQRSVVLGHKHAARVMKDAGGGSIISTASIAGVQGGATDVSYSGSKAAVISFVRTATTELGRYGIRSNAIAPGLIMTPILTQRIGLEPEELPAFFETLARQAGHLQPLGRVGQPRDVAEVALFLASDGSAFMSGQTLIVDGGVTCAIRLDLGAMMANAAQDILAAR